MVKVKPLILRHPEQVLARPVGLMRRFQMEQFWALLRVQENPKGKTTRHWLWKVKDIPTCGPEPNPGISSSSSWDLNSGCSGERQTCLPRAPPSLMCSTRNLDLPKQYEWGDGLLEITSRRLIRSYSQFSSRSITHPSECKFELQNFGSRTPRVSVIVVYRETRVQHVWNHFCTA